MRQLVQSKRYAIGVGMPMHLRAKIHAKEVLAQISAIPTTQFGKKRPSSLLALYADSSRAMMIVTP